MLSTILAAFRIDPFLLAQAVCQSIAADFHDVAWGRPVKTTFDRPGGDLIQRDGIGTDFFGETVEDCLHLFAESSHCRVSYSLKLRFGHIAPAIDNGILEEMPPDRNLVLAQIIIALHSLLELAHHDRGVDGHERSKPDDVAL